MYQISYPSFLSFLLLNPWNLVLFLFPGIVTFNPFNEAHLVTGNEAQECFLDIAVEEDKHLDVRDPCEVHIPSISIVHQISQGNVALTLLGMEQDRRGFEVNEVLTALGLCQ